MRRGARAEIGKQTGLKIQRSLTPCRFKSDRAHQDNIVMKYYIVLSLIIPFFTLSNDTDFDEKIKKYILENPEVIIKSLNEYQDLLVEKEKNSQKEIIEENKTEINNSHQFIGNKDGKYIITEFFDYRCGYCVKAHKELARLSKENKDLKIVLKNLPILTKDSDRLARISLALSIKYPEKFEEFHDYIYINARVLDNEKIKKYLKKIRVDPNKILNFAMSDEIRELMDKDFNLAKILKVSGTPAFIVNNQFFTGWVGNDILLSAFEN